MLKNIESLQVLAFLAFLMNGLSVHFDNIVYGCSLDDVDGNVTGEMPYRKFSYLATLSHAVSGGIESPIQFCFQVCMYFWQTVC